MGYLNMHFSGRCESLLNIFNLFGTRAECGSHDEFGRSETGHLREREGGCLCRERGCSESHCWIRLKKKKMNLGITDLRERERERES